MKLMNQSEVSLSEIFENRIFRKNFSDNSMLMKAVIGHYVHNKDNCVTKTYERSAMKYAKLVAKFAEKDLKIEIVSDELFRLFEDLTVPFPPPKQPQFTFIDLFAGIGGFRIAMQNLGGKCVFSSEWDREAQKTYELNFGEVPFGDITKEETKKYVPEGFDLLCAGFPCQAFSIAGKRGGFEDTRGTLFFDVAEIIRRKRPKAIFLENVKGLQNHRSGETLETILNTLRRDLKYFVPDPKIMNAKDFGLPQNRERIFIVGFRNDLGITDFEYPKPLNEGRVFQNVKEEKVPSTKYYLSTRYLQTLIKHKARHEKKGNGFGYEIVEDNSIANAIVVGGMGRERNLVVDDRLTDFSPVTKIKGEVNREGIRRMTPREWARLQGFPDNFRVEVSDASAYKQFGNSVAVPAIQATAEKILRIIQKEENHRVERK